MSLYLSKLQPNLRSSKARRDLANAYELHRTLSRGIGENEKRLLWRVEEGAKPHILVQTRTEPDWSYLDEGVPPSYLIGKAAIKRVAIKLTVDQVLRFRLRGNPTVKRLVNDKKKRLGLYKEDEQLAWLARKGEQSGFRLLGTSILREEAHEFRRDGKQVTIHAVTFDGHLAVIDPEALVLAVVNGIGSAKGFGMGLLSLAPAS